MANVKNIDIEKFLAALDKKEKDACYDHMLKTKIEETRYNQERETLNQVIDMFYSTAYEKREEISQNGVLITKDQYDEYQALMNNLDFKLNQIMEVELDNWSKDVLNKLVNCLKGEEYLIYGSNKDKKICNISYEELNKVLAYAFSLDLITIKEFNPGDGEKE